jgi:signal transduction histidine kinase/HAMP domain-containing protein
VSVALTQPPGRRVRRQRRSSLRTRWLGVLAVMLSITVFTGMAGVFAVTQLTDHFASLVQTTEANMAASSDLRVALAYEGRLAFEVLSTDRALDAAFLGADQEVAVLFDRAAGVYREPGDAQLLQDASAIWRNAYDTPRRVAATPGLLRVLAPTIPAQVNLRYGIQSVEVALSRTLLELDQRYRAEIATQLSQARTDRMRLLVVLAVLSVVSAAVLLVAARRLSRDVLTPIRGISAAVDRYAGGELDHHIELPRSDRLGEIGDLADRCNSMADSLASTEAQLEGANDELRVTLREQSAVSALSQLALQTADPRAVMAEATEVLAVMLGVDRAGVFEPLPDGQALLLRAGSGWPEAVGILNVPLSQDTLVGLAFATEEAIGSAPGCLPDADLASGACVVIMGGGTRLGVLGVFATGPRTFTAGELAFLHSVGYIVGSAIYAQSAQFELKQAQKLEAVGRLASGVAHEINTPIQFITDNLRFIGDSLASLDTLITSYRQLSAVADLAELDIHRRELLQIENDLDLEFLRQEAPLAASQALDGADRVARIVRAMKAFSHQDTGTPTEADLNESLRNALVMATNEIKDHADVETAFDDIPLLRCFEGELNQVFLNLLVNAAHAVADVQAATGQRGTIRVSSSFDAGQILVSVTDTGTGIAEEVKNNVFDPFFTTKEVGKGSGQGLYLARTTTERHHGCLTFTSTPGAGTTFTIRLPVEH